MTSRRALPALLAALVLTVPAAPARAQAGACDPAALGPAPDEVVLGYTGQSVPRSVVEALAAAPLVTSAVDDRPPYYARIAGVEVGDPLADVLRALPEVRFVEANHSLCIARLPDDPLVGQMWSVHNASTGAGLPAAWDRAPLGAVTVAVLDTGMELGHPDLAPNVWTNPGETAGNGRDDDGNGYVDDSQGVNAIARSGSGSDDHGHGTFVAGIVGARGNNAIGIAGAAWEARLMPVKTMDGQGRGVSTDTADGIRYAVDKGARILNLSVNGETPDTVQREAIEYANARGAIIVASAGNEGRDIDAAPSYPASWSHGNVIGVAASRQGGDLAAFSNRGLRAVELSAPGDLVTSTTLGGGYGQGSGTSYAAPHVAGALALLAGARPDLSAGGLIEHLLAGARPPAGLPVGRGRLDAGASLARVVPSGAGAATPPAGGGGGPAPGGGSGGSGGPGGGGGGGSSVSGAELSIRLARSSRRVRAGRRKLRWTVTGEVGRIRAVRVLLGRRAVARARVSPSGSRLSVKARVRLRPGRRKVRLELRDAAGARLGARTATILVRRR